MNNPYLSAIYKNLPRILALYDCDVTSETYGLGDRYHWAWGLIDFANGTFQGVAHGIARLVEANLLPDYLDEASAIELVDRVFCGTSRIIRSDGSLEEAFPYEGSYCVTALVAFDLLSSIELLGERIQEEKKQEYLSTVAKLIEYLKKSDEHHALISNHLATAVAALVKWNKVSGVSDEGKGSQLLDRILSNQSLEGWYLEYDGADPGYQSLCSYYLADVLHTTSNKELLKSLESSLGFLAYFVHPDGSFGGEYGSRNTRFYYPGGIEYLRRYSKAACSISDFMRSQIELCSHVGLDAIDEPNLIPMFNSYCLAACLFDKSERQVTKSTLPCFSVSEFVKEFPSAGLIIYKNLYGYHIVSTAKGGVVYSFNEIGKITKNAGVAIRTESGKIYTNQSFNLKNKYALEENSVVVSSELKLQSKRVFKPYQMLVLRILNITFMRNMKLREIVKKILVKILITGNSKSIGSVNRKIVFGNETLVSDTIDSALPVELIQGSFVSIHMASKGYWQRRDTKKNEE